MTSFNAWFHKFVFLKDRGAAGASSPLCVESEVIMYKFIAGILALLLCLALAGCGGGDSSSESSRGGMNIHEMWTDEA